MTDAGRLRKLEERYEGYTVYDNGGSKVGKVDGLFVDETDREEYIGVKMGLFGHGGMALIPMELARVDDRSETVEVAEVKDRLKDAPTYESGEDEITPGHEDKVRRHFGLEPLSQAAGGSSGQTSGQPGGEEASGDQEGELKPKRVRRRIRREEVEDIEEESEFTGR